LELHFARDAMGRIGAEGTAPGANPLSESYQYDPLNRLKELDNGTGALEQSVTYNPTGDRLSQTLAGQSPVTYGYQAGTHQLTSVGTAQRLPDANGNTTAMIDPNGDLIGLGYDDRNLLTAITRSGITIGAYQYNGLGVRVWRTITSPNAGQAATVYDPTGTGSLYGEYFATDYREYVYLDGIPVASATDAGRAAPGINYLYADHLGSVRAIVNPQGQGNYQWPWLNNAFGASLTTGTSSFYTRFPGQYLDVETGLEYNGARYYDSSVGRYLQSDPIGLFGGQPSTYAYARSNPLSYTDPSGLFVRGSYSISTGLLTFYDTSNPTDVYTTYASTGGTFQSNGSFISNGDAIPVGSYDILGTRNPGFYRLDPEDGSPFNDEDEATGRGAFRLHPGTHSLGCITVDKNSYNNKLYENIQNLIDNTSTTTVTDAAQRSLFPGAWPVRYGPPVSTPVTYYGKLEVTP
jgi:RHS repeat-associated protein